jgi:hypothetical protein
MSDTPERVTTDAYIWDRMITNLVKAGYGDYNHCANAEIIDAVTFLFLYHRKTEADKIRNFFGR